MIMPEGDEFETYSRHLCVEHQRLNRLLLEARHRIDVWRASGDHHTPADVLAELQAIRGELEHHFAEEEAEGCLEEAMCRFPSLAPQTNAVLHEHQGIRDDFSRLCERAQQGIKEGTDLPQFVAEYERLYTLLHAHEAEESRIVQQAFAATLDTGNEPALD
jgi:hypothetical protein